MNVWRMAAGKKWAQKCHTHTQTQWLGHRTGPAMERGVRMPARAEV